MQEEIELTVGDLSANRQDYGRGLARLSSNFMSKIGVREGNYIQVEGKRKTYLIAIRSYPNDIGLDIIRMDGIARRNCKTGVGEKVKVRKANLKEANRIVIAPAQEGVMIHTNPEYMLQNLFKRPFAKGDIFVPTPVVRRRDIDFFGDFFESFFEDQTKFFTPFGNIKFIVVDISPKEGGYVGEETEIEVLSKAVEVKEEERVPEVTYEDIGGLKREIDSVREIIELPIRHPELFQRLGVKPPKGVLLHGPPGTGKTLLAKAVANESGANFYSINGPEIMCVDGKTKIFTNPKGYIKAEEIYGNEGSFVREDHIKVKELKKPISTFSFTKNGIEKGKITHITKLKAPSYKISFDDGIELIVSPNQPFLVYENGELKWKKLQELKEREFVAKVDKIELPEENLKIDLRKIPNLIERNGKYALKSKNQDRSNFIRLPKQMNKELMEFLGLIVSEGSIFEDSIVFSNNEKYLKDRFKKLLKDLFGIEKVKEYKSRVIFYSKVLVEYLKLLGYTKNNKLVIPAYFYKLSKDEIGSFVKGYFEGDGSVNTLKGKNAYTTPVLYSKDREFLKELKNLMQLKLGIMTKLKEHNTKKGLMYKLVVRGREGRKRFSKISCTGKMKKLQEINKIKGNREFKKIPFPKLLISAIREKLPYSEYKNFDIYVYNKRDFTKYAMKKLYDIAEKNNIITEEIKKEFKCLSREDVCFTKINKIEYLGKRELYDFTVDKDNFVADLLFLHNSKWYGQSEENLRKIFEDAEKNTPAIIFIDEIDAIAPKREEVTGEVERRVVSQLLTMMDGLKGRGKVIVIGATNRPDSLDPALRRPGRFDREIEIGVPNQEGRLEILQIHSRNMPLAKDVNLKKLAEKTYGFVGADLEALCKEAAMHTLRRILPDLSSLKDKELPREVIEKLTVTKEDFDYAMQKVEPSAMREVLVEIPNVKWEDIGGLEEIKQKLKEMVEWPLKYPEKFEHFHITPPKGILLYGPPGTGKTLLAKAVANESGANFISVKGPELLSKWVGESERKLREIFRRAKQAAPSIIFFDEIDAMTRTRGMSTTQVVDTLVSQLLTELSGMEELKNVVVIAATNRPDMVDYSLLRPGRFDRHILVPPPDEKSRREILKIHLRNVPLSKNVNLSELAKKTKNFSGADLEALCREASMLALRESLKDKKIDKVDKKHFEEVLKKMRPSIPEVVAKSYEKFEKSLNNPITKKEKSEIPDYMS